MCIITSAARTAAAAVTVSALILAGAAVAAAPASAAVAAAPASAADVTPTVTIGKIAKKSVVKGKKATIKPVVKAKGNVEILSKTVTVTKAGKSFAKGKRSATLGAGVYKVKTTVTYRTWKTESGKTQVAVPLEDGTAERTCPTSDITAVTETDDYTHTADVTCTDPESNGTVSFAGVHFAYDADDEVWLGDQEGTLVDITLDDLMDTTPQTALVTPEDELDVSVDSTVKVWSKIKTKKSVQTVKVGAK